MERKLIRTVVITSLITAMVVSGLAYYVGPKIMNRDADNAALQPALYNGPAQPDNYDQPAPRAMRRSSYYAPPEPSYSQPVRHHRSTRDSVLIVAGSAGTGAAIGGLAGGGKGAGIGALVGGLGGLVYDRMTANK
jgi:hypothetical protein